MATEKILNTRIQLKYDTLQNWNSSTFALKAGELAIVTTGSMKDNSTHTNAQYPVLFKVGDGEHKFSELPFASALAADVYAWAKADDVVLSGKVIQFKSGDSVVKSVTLNYATPAEVESAISAARELISAEIDADVADEAALRVAADNALSGRIAALESGDASVAKQIENAIKALDSNASQTAGADGLALAVEIVDGKLTSISGSIAAGTYDAAGAAATAKSEAIAAAAEDATTKADAAKSGAEATAAAALATSKTEISAEIDADVKAEADRAKGVEAGLQSAIDAINGNDGILKQAKDYVDGEIDKVEAAIEDVIDGTTPVAKATDADKLGGVAAADYATKAYADQAEADAIAAAKEYTDGVKDAILGDGIKDTFDTLVEIQNWIEGDGVNATELTEAIAAEAKIRGEEDAKLSKAIADEATAARAAEEQLGKDIDAEESRAKGEEARIEGLVTAEVSAREKAVSDEETARKAADKAIQDQIDALGIADGKVAEAERADSAAMADKANSLTDAAKAEVKAVKVDNAAKADEATHATNADAATKATQDAAGNVITETYETKTDAAQKLADAKFYADQAELDAIASAKSYTDGREAAIKTAYEAYADQAEADAKAYADGLAGNYATAAQGKKADTAVQTVVGDTGLKATKSGTKVTIGFDPDVVFVFNCGSATELVD